MYGGCLSILWKLVWIMWKLRKIQMAKVTWFYHPYYYILLKNCVYLNDIYYNYYVYLLCISSCCITWSYRYAAFISPCFVCVSRVFKWLRHILCYRNNDRFNIANIYSQCINFTQKYDFLMPLSTGDLNMILNKKSAFRRDCFSPHGHTANSAV